MIGTTKRVAICAALLALGGMTAACGDDDDGMMGTDAGPMDAGGDEEDAGGDEEDAGGGDEDGGGDTDAGTDGGTPASAFIRLAHLISNVPGAPAAMGGVHVCLQPPGTTTQLLITRNAAGAATPVPYGGVSNYTDQLMLLALPYMVHVYEAADVTGTTCPATTEALFSQEVDASLLTAPDYFTIAAVGRVGGTGDEAASLVILADDITEPATDMTRVRIVHGITGIPVNVDVCYDPDFEIGAGGPEPGAMPAEALATDVGYIGGSEGALEIPYAERDPMPDGALLVYVRAPAPIDCAAPGDRAPNVVIPLPFPVPSGAGIPENLTATVDAGDVVTIFFRGHSAAETMVTPAPCTVAADTCATVTGNEDAFCHPVALRCVHPEAPTLTPWIDDLGIER